MFSNPTAVFKVVSAAWNMQNCITASRPNLHDVTVTWSSHACKPEDTCTQLPPTVKLFYWWGRIVHTRACVRALQHFFVCARACKCGVATRVQQLLCECRLARVSLTSLTKENLTCNCFHNLLSFFISVRFLLSGQSDFLPTKSIRVTFL